MVKENVDGYVIEEKADDPQNLVAKKEGTVERIITRNGIRRCPPGDTCQAGRHSCKGRDSAVNDSGENVLIILMFTQTRDIDLLRRRGTIL